MLLICLPQGLDIAHLGGCLSPVLMCAVFSMLRATAATFLQHYDHVRSFSGFLG